MISTYSGSRSIPMQSLPSSLHATRVVPLPANRAEIGRIIREELAYKGVSVIIPQRECMQTLARKQRKKQAAK